MNRDIETDPATSIDSAARTETAPPKILDIEWTPDPVKPGYWHAKRAYDFNYAEAYVVNEMPPPWCIDVGYDGLTFKAQLVGEGGLEEWIEALEQKISNREERERAHRRYYHKAFGAQHIEATTAAINEALELYDTYGAACRDVKAMLTLVQLRYLDARELRQLNRILGKTRIVLANMATIAAKIEPKPYPLPLDDDFVEQGVHELTALDRDRHRIANGEGWSPKTSACGHWCSAIMKTDREKALRVGRVLVSHHMDQLRRLGIVPAAVASRRVARSSN